MPTQCPVCKGAGKTSCPVCAGKGSIADIRSSTVMRNFILTISKDPKVTEAALRLGTEVLKILFGRR